VYRIIRRSWAPVALLSLALLALTPVAAAAEPALVFDASVDVVVSDQDGGRVEGAGVHLVAYVNDFPDSVPPFDGHAFTDAAGVAHFGAVPRPGDGAPGVYLAAEATKPGESLDEDYCLESRLESGSVIDVPSAAAVRIDVATKRTSQTTCRTLSGSIRSAGGEPQAGLLAIVVSLPGSGGRWKLPVDVGPDGSFRQGLPPYGTEEDPASVALSFTGIAQRDRDSRGCARIVQQLGSWELSLPLGVENPAPLALRTVPDVTSEACGVVSGPGSGGSAGPTLPPTDTQPGGVITGVPHGATSGGPGDGAPAGLATGWIVLAGALGAALVLMRRGSAWRPRSGGGR
jgi:hypothetical protein